MSRAKPVENVHDVSASKTLVYARVQSADRSRPEIAAQLAEEPFLPELSPDGMRGLRIPPGCARASVHPDPSPCNEQERRITHEVVEIIEPTIRIMLGGRHGRGSCDETGEHHHTCLTVNGRPM